MSRCVSLNQARANASANWSGCSKKRREIFSYAGSSRRERSVVSIVGTCFFDVSKASGMEACAPFAFHCFAPAGLFVSSHSFSNRFLKKKLLHFVGVGANAGAVLALPAEALILDRPAFGRGSDQRRIARAVSLAEGVAAGNQRN